MSYIKSAEQAWHDAYATIKKSPSDFGFVGGGNLDGHLTYIAELAKITSAISVLPEHQKRVGMVIYAAEFSPSDYAYVRQLLWDKYHKARSSRLNSIKQTERMTLLISISIQEARLRSNAKVLRVYSSTEVGQLLQLGSVQQYNRDWRHDMELLSNSLLDNAVKAIEPINDVVREINRKYLLGENTAA